MSYPKSDDLVDAALAAAVTAIESYNSPNAEYREQTFSILIVNAWELLLKAKILKDNSEDIESVYVKDEREKSGFKTNRNGTPWTLDIFDALRRTDTSVNVQSNLDSLTEIRDSSIHFLADPDIKYVLAILAIASVVNFKTICSEWFSRSLEAYNFAVLPLSFDYDFKQLQRADLSVMPEGKARLIQNIFDRMESGDDDQYFFMCEIGTRLVSIKKASGDVDITAGITGDASEGSSVIVRQKVNVNEQYPYTYTEIREMLKAEGKGVGAGILNEVIKRYDIKKNPKYSALNFRNLKHQKQFEKDGIVTSGTSQIYNAEGLAFIRSKASELIANREPAVP